MILEPMYGSLALSSVHTDFHKLSQFSIVCEIYVFSHLQTHQKSKAKDIILRATTYHMCISLVNSKGTTILVKNWTSRMKL